MSPLGREQRGARPRRSVALLGSLGLAAVSLALVLGGFEIGLRLAGYSALYDVYSKPSLFWTHDELLGWSLRPGAEGTYVGPRPFPVEFEAPVRINGHGLRGPEIDERAPGEYRVLVLGDSVVAGLEVAYQDTFVAVMEKQLQRRLDVPVRVINGGVRGYGTDQAYLYYRERGRLLEPDLVVLVHSMNDPNDNVTLHRMRRPFGKPAFALGDDGALELVGAPVPRYPLCSAYMLSESFEPVRVDGPLERVLCFVQTRGADHSALFTFVARALGRMPGIVVWLKDLTYPGSQREGTAAGRRGAATAPPPLRASVFGLEAPAQAATRSPRLEFDLTTALVRALDTAARDDGADFVLIIKPGDRAQLDAESLTREGVDLRSLLLPFPVDRALLHFRNDGHYNERGHRLMARTLGPIVESYYHARRAAPDGNDAPAAEGAARR